MNRNTLKAYITLPDGIGMALVIRALEKEFKDVDFSVANDNTYIISCKTPHDQKTTH